MGGWYELTRRWVLRGSRTLVGRDRAQSQVIGAILIFGFVIAGLGLYQVTVVPQQTSEVELQHSSTVKDDFADVHSAMVEAGATNDIRTASVKLGTRYPPRALTLNPSPVQGRIGMKNLGGSVGFGTPLVSESDVCDLQASPKTLTYEANYNRLTGGGHHGYETSVTYHAADGKIVSSSQVLVQGTTVRLLPMTTGTVSTTSIERQTLEFEGGSTGGTQTPPGTSLTLQLPTDLTVDQWKTILAEAEKVQTSSISKDPATGRVLIPLEPGQYTVRCTPIGEGKEPSNSPILTPGGGGSGPSPGFGINPNEEGVVFLEGTGTVKKSKTAEATFQYEPEPSGTKTSTNIVSGRVNFVSPDAPGFSGSGSEEVRICDSSSPATSSKDFRVGGDTKSFDVPITVTDTGRDLRFTFDPSSTGGNSGKITAKSFYVVTFKFSNGEVGTYFLSHNKGGNSLTDCPSP